MKRGFLIYKHSGKKSANIGKKQKCPNCGHKIGILAGSLDAICHMCGYKDPCCE